jgi:hypothetical protein
LGCYWPVFSFRISWLLWEGSLLRVERSQCIDGSGEC